jgi:Peptidase M15
MLSRLKLSAVAVFALAAQALFAWLILAPVSAAHAEIVPFWEEADKPAITGRAPRAAKAKARAAKRDVASDDSDDTPVRRKKRNVRVASRGGEDYDPRPSRRSLTGGAVSWSASSRCLNGTLVSLVGAVASTYGPVTVTSTCRSRGHNASVGGAPRSQHLTGDAVDFRVNGNVSGAMAFLRSNGSVGGFHHYGGGLFHIDTGPRRTW